MSFCRAFSIAAKNGAGNVGYAGTTFQHQSADKDNDTEADENGSAYRYLEQTWWRWFLANVHGLAANDTQELPPLPVDPMTATFSFVAESDAVFSNSFHAFTQDTIYTITSLSLNDTIFRSEPAEAGVAPALQAVESSLSGIMESEPLGPPGPRAVPGPSAEVWEAWRVYEMMRCTSVSWRAATTSMTTTRAVGRPRTRPWRHDLAATAAWPSRGLFTGFVYEFLPRIGTSKKDRDEIYFRNLRHDEHYIDKKGRHTAAFFGARRRKFAPDERHHIRDCMTLQDSHPREKFLPQRRTEIQLAQIENSGSYQGFKERTASMFDDTIPKRYSISNSRYANEQAKLQAKRTSKAEFRARRGETVTHSASCPSLHLTAPEQSLDRSMRGDTRKEVSQLQTESAHFAPWMSYNTLSGSIDGTAAGRAHAAAQKHLSVSRLENFDFGVARANNHYSAADKLTRADPFYMRPRVGDSQNSVKYDIITNERRWFKY
ncbi:hypothetical protein AK812_SmicGene3746 [Symbiodinium microadriaticum]|uniref:Uncharacterized protein n=1 Tax=Symbiodinium microadriaticum TaxID=2951 RepID=A0A1Q9EY61_SYMMI|nr:hypothetical protein AK812_SmicGene3746 [Symbiodinium microadriaticum]CAE7497549.1 unnamed protein product [Symbiodinium sp. KB8]